MSPARALRLGLARAAAQLYELPVQVTEVKSTGLGGEEVAAACGPDMLLALLDGPDGARGAVALNRAMVAALIEVQVMGVVSTLELSDRALTPTDAAMVAPWLDAALERVDLALAEGLPEGTGPDCGKAGDWLVGYRFGAMAEDARALALALDATRFHLLRLTVDVALGRRTGEIALLLPAADMAEGRNPPQRRARVSCRFRPSCGSLPGACRCPCRAPGHCGPAMCCRWTGWRWPRPNCDRLTAPWPGRRGWVAWASIGRCALARPRGPSPRPSRWRIHQRAARPPDRRGRRRKSR